MNKLSSLNYLNIIFKILIILIITKGISFLLMWYLPKEGVNQNIQENYHPRYQRVKFSNMLSRGKNTNSRGTNVSSGNTNITNMVLKGLYGKDSHGFIIIATKSNPKKTSIVAIGEDYQGYTLKTILIKSVVFYKNGSEYILNLEKIKKLSNYIKAQTQETLTQDAPQQQKHISRQDITYFSTNPNQVWKNISIQEVREGGTIKGFKVTGINKNSKFAQLGLKKGDLIIKANNVKLDSYKKVMKIYEQMNDLDFIQIVVIRDGERVELVYEIN